jgi:hypothetical protein
MAAALIRPRERSAGLDGPGSKERTLELLASLQPRGHGVGRVAKQSTVLHGPGRRGRCEESESGRQRQEEQQRERPPGSNIRVPSGLWRTLSCTCVRPPTTDLEKEVPQEVSREELKEGSPEELVIGSVTGGRK